MSNIITFYDIPSKAPGNYWFALNFKGIPYKVEWVEYPDIEATCKKLGVSPTSKKSDGSPLYTLPVIYDPSTKTALSDSIPIAEYLDATYPDTPKLFPPGTRGLQVGALHGFFACLDPLWPFVVPRTNAILNPSSEEYFRRTREQQFGKKLEDLPPVGDKRAEEWTKVKDGFERVDKWLQKENAGGGGSFFLGSTVCFADLVIASYLFWLKVIFGETSDEWKEITSWSDGRWGRFMAGLEKYL